MKTRQADDFWALAAKPRLLPRETRDYVPMILAAIVIARNPAQYGFDFEPSRRTTYETVTLPRPVDLRRVAEWTDTTIDEIQALNPELRRWTTPVRDDAVRAEGAGRHARSSSERRLDGGDRRPTWRRSSGTPSRRARRSRRSREKLRVSRTDLAEANYLKTTRARRRRPEADGAARGDGADGGAHRPLRCRSPSRGRWPPTRSCRRSRRPAPTASRSSTR